MIDLRFGVKIYEADWLIQSGLDVEQAADLLAGWGVTYVITQSSFLPMHDTAVESVVKPEGAASHRARKDIEFRMALLERGIGYLGCLNICFDPEMSRLHPDLVPTDQFGNLAAQQDWYLGIAPDRDVNLSQKSDLLENAVRALDPDGIHLGFVRWPGFWETWLPDVSRPAQPNYCFSRETLAHFRIDTGIDVPVDNPAAASDMLLGKYLVQWRDWKCAVTASAIGRLRKVVQDIRPGTEIAINTLPFLRSDFDDAVTEVFGQDVAGLSPVVDIFEVMAYHQIMGRDSAWPANVAGDIKHRGTPSRAICTLQAKAMYLDGMHAGLGRAQDYPADEFIDALARLETGPADGVCIFTLSHLLETRETGKGRTMLDALGRFRR
jgi:hypothetical protein